ncbi:hypothetical protein ACFVZH_32650 [Streptomyces sp. NPDC059534]|uniref:hypothetical protein n=1 Tax=Streptomyces sp. NPDC059534 TaxID=3346859 RepID=UPI003698F98F
MTEAPARTPGAGSAPAVHPTDLPGVRARLRDVTSDLAAGLNCLWLVTDAMVESGLADALYREALAAAPVHVDVPAPTPVHVDVPAPAPERAIGPRPAPAPPRAGTDDGWWTETDELPYLDLPDDGFDLDLGWTLDGRPPRVPAPRREPGAPRHDPHGLTARLGGRLSVTPDEAVPALLTRAREQRPVVGIRAWREHDDGSGTRTDGDGGTAIRARTDPDQATRARTDPDQATRARPATDPATCARTPSGAGSGRPAGAATAPETGPAPPRGAAVERLFRSLAAAVREAGLPPAERPRLLVVARLRDLPEPLPDELRDGLGDTAVHWWWGALGRLDTATAIAPVLDHRPGATGRARDPLADRVRGAVRSETVVEICGPDLELARLLVLEWDGAQHTLAGTLGRCLAATGGPTPGECPPLRRIGALARPGAELRQAWARGAVVSWEGRLRHHVSVWHPAAPADGTAAVPTADGRARLAALVSQAQQRVLNPWIEEARQRLAARALGHLGRPVAAVVADHADRPPAYPGADPERAFLELQVGELLGAHISGALALPPDDARLLRLLVMARNVLSHRSVLYDRTLDDLCAELSRADLRAS